MMELIKIYPDKIQIKTNNQQLKDIRIHSAMKIIDKESGNCLVCVVTAISRNEQQEEFDFDGNLLETEPTSTIDCAIIGSLHKGVFEKSVDVYPTSQVRVEKITEDSFRSMLATPEQESFRIGVYANYNCPAYLNGSHFFQRHSAILGSTGSGKSYTEAGLLEKIAKLKSSNAIVFDLHGEYSDLSYVKKIKIGEKGLPFPLWFLPFKDIYGNVLHIKEESSHLQLGAFRKAFYAARGSNKSEDTPVSFLLSDVIKQLEEENSTEIATGEIYKSGAHAGEEKRIKGEQYGKLTNLITLLKDLEQDKRYQFMTRPKPQAYLYHFIQELFSIEEKNVKVIDLSDISSDMIPTIVAVTAKLIYKVQRQQQRKCLMPLNLICDEAHVYIPANEFGLGASQRRLLDIFETIAKEGRKFGMTLTIVSQRPAELNKTILAQCANFIVLKLSNDADKQIVKGNLPDSSKEILDSITLFQPGDCLVVGDSAKIALKIKLDLPEETPNSSTIDTWREWSKEKLLNTDQLVDLILR